MGVTEAFSYAGSLLASPSANQQPGPFGPAMRRGMTSGPDLDAAVRGVRAGLAALPDHAARIRFRQPVSTAGHVDAAWWPRSLDLVDELPPLLGVLWTADRQISRVTYSITGWNPAPRRLRVEGRMVRLGGFAASDPLTIRLVDDWGVERIDVLVVPAATDPAVAHWALLFASEPANPDRAGTTMARACKAGLAAHDFDPALVARGEPTRASAASAPTA